MLDWFLSSMHNVRLVSLQYALCDTPTPSYEKKLESIMDYNAMSPDNSMALFYAFLLLAETKFSEGNLTAGTYMFMDFFTVCFTA